MATKERKYLAYEPTVDFNSTVHNFGLPYHGLVKGVDRTKQLIRNGYVDRTYPMENDIDGGDVVLVQHPKHHAPAPKQPNDGYNFEEYALLSGADKIIGGMELGAKRWIYCDENYSWLITLEDIRVITGVYPLNFIDYRLEVWVEGPFGLFPAPTTQERRKIGEFVFTPLRYDGSPASYGVGRDIHPSDPTIIHLSHSSDGRVTIANVGNDVGQRGGLTVWNNTTLPRKVFGFLSGQGVTGFHTAVKLELTGNGSLTPYNIGKGINVTFTTEWIAPDYLLSEDSSDTTNGIYRPYTYHMQTISGSLPPLAECNGTPTGELVSTQVETWSPFVAYDTNGPWDQQTSSLLSTVQTSSSVIKYYPNVKPDKSIIYLEFDVYTYNTYGFGNGISGDIIVTTDFYWTGCYLGYKTYTQVTNYSGAHVLTYWSWSHSNYTATIRWGSAEETHEFQFSRNSGYDPGEGTSYNVCTTTQNPPPYGEMISGPYYCQLQDTKLYIDGILVPDTTNGVWLVYRTTNNTFATQTNLTGTVLTIGGEKIDFSGKPVTSPMTYHPVTREFSYDLTLPVCFV